MRPKQHLINNTLTYQIPTVLLYTVINIKHDLQALLSLMETFVFTQIFSYQWQRPQPQHPLSSGQEPQQHPEIFRR